MTAKRIFSVLWATISQGFAVSAVLALLVPHNGEPRLTLIAAFAMVSATSALCSIAWSNVE